ncbi:MAG: SGNH/GDSL hydrolase family protein [Deltaproteobacteria bacterium]|nr:SGNH/GDSL hydrolase family protein [Deltaproteobacteria bacterium]
MESLVTLGSSSTLGAGASRPEETGWVPLLLEHLRARLPIVALHNLGKGGAVMADYLEAWPLVADCEPTLLVVLPFTDYATTPLLRFKDDCRRLIDAANTLAEAAQTSKRRFQVFFGDLRIDPLYLEGTKPDGPRYRLKDYVLLLEKNGALQELAKEAPFLSVVPVIDQNAIHPEWIHADGHPNDLGHAYLAGCFVRAVELWLDGGSIDLDRAILDPRLVPAQEP